MRWVRGAIAGAVVAAVVAAAVAPAAAQEQPSRFDVRLAGGLGGLAIADRLELGVHAQLGVTLGASRALRLRPEVSYHRLASVGGEMCTTGVPGECFPGGRELERMLAATGSVVWGSRSGAARPYVIGGVGYYRGWAAGEGWNATGVNGGVGVDFVGARAGAFVEVRVHRVRRGLSPGGATLVPVTVGVRL